jgi:hypothetical protein
VGANSTMNFMQKREYCPICYKHLCAKYIRQHSDSKHPEVSVIDFNARKWELRKLVWVRKEHIISYPAPLYITFLLSVTSHIFVPYRKGLSRQTHGELMQPGGPLAQPFTGVPLQI